MAKNGGVRPGAGRPPGRKNIKTLLLEQKVRELGLSPLDIMLERMKTCYVNGDLAAAHEAAKDAAPYLHAKLSSIDARLDHTHNHHLIVDDAFERLSYELDRLAAERGQGRGPQKVITGRAD